MKRRIAILTTVLLCALIPGAYAGDPIPGLDVKLGKNPGGIVAHVSTRKDGYFVFDKVLPAGEYVLSMSWDEAVRAASKNNPAVKGKAEPAITVSYEIVTPRDMATGQASGKRMHKPITIRKEWGGVTITIPEGGATLSGSVVVVE